MQLLVSKEKEEEECDLTEENKQLTKGIKLCVTRLGKLVIHKHVQNYKI